MPAGLNRTDAVVTQQPSCQHDEAALEATLQSGKVHSAALDVFEVEPLPMDSYLRTHARCVFGSHNASNTVDAVVRTSEIAIDKLTGFLDAK